MSTIGCVVFKVGLMLCQPGDQFIETYVAGDTPKRLMETTAFIKDTSTFHMNAWAGLTDAKLEEAFADWGPRRHLPIDWSKVKGYKP